MRARRSSHFGRYAGGLLSLHRRYHRANGDKMSAQISRHFYDVLTPPRAGSEGRAQEYMDMLNADGSIMQTIKVGSPAPVATVAEAVARANGEAGS